ncbi:MAG: proprotein convertase P-domain-containing protein [Saprospirales bacterium]|nr:proprotein convertase P-domain-containing protein [Saprospirales bacterium]
MNQRILLWLLCFLAPALPMSGQNYLMNGSPINDCGGFFLDSGGGANNYGANQNFTTVICPDFSTGTHIRLNFSGVDVIAPDMLCFFDGPNTGSPSLGCSSDFLPGAPFIVQATAANPGGCLTITFNSNASVQGAGWAAAIECIPACQIITSVLVNSDPAVSPVDTGYIDICPGDQVSFTGHGLFPQNGVVYNHSDLTSTFEWDFGDGAIGLGPNVSHPYPTPGGYVVQLTITDQFGCRNTNFLSQRVRVAPYPVFELSPDWDNEICVGDTIAIGATVSQDTSGSVLTILPPPEGSFQSTGIRSDSLPLPDGTGASYESSIYFSDFAPGQVLTNINDLLGIGINIEHSYVRDLEISLSCPDGTSITLHNFAGQIGGEVFLGEPYEADEGFNPPIPGVGYDYNWTQNATNGTWLQYANNFSPQTLPPGDYNSFDPLTDLLGCPLNGEWTITVQDLWAIDNGYIFSWSVQFDPDLYPDLETFTADYIDWEWDSIPSITYFSQDSIEASPENAGVASYTFFLYDEFGCTWDTTVQVNVLPFTHPDCHNCQDNITLIPDTTVCVGDQVTLNVGVAATAPAVTFESYQNYPLGFANHPHANPYQSPILVNSIFPAVITNPLTNIAQVCFDLNTNFLSDIIVRLRAPNGAIMELTSNNGGTSDFYTQTCFTPTAVTPITAGTTPFTGNYIPEGSWNTLNGAPINGNWTLLVSDGAGPNFFGNFNSWSITFNTQNTVTYSWTPNSTLSCTNCPAPVATPQSANTYIVQAQDSYACLYTDSIAVSIAPPIPAPLVSCDPSVANQILFSWTQIDTFTQYQVNVNNQGWGPPNGALSHLLTGLPNGALASIEVQVINNGSFCEALIGTSDCVTCTVELAAQTVAGITCASECDGSVQLLATGGLPTYTYTVIHTGGQYVLTQSGNGFFNTLCPGPHLGIVEDLGGCLDTVSFIIGGANPLFLSVNQILSVSCFGENDGEATAIPSGGAGNFTYLWGDPLAQILPTATLLSAGPVTVTVTDGNGCKISGSTTITQPPQLVLSTTFANVPCFGGSTGSAQVTAAGGTSPYDYLWNDLNGTITPTVSGLPAGMYEVEVTDDNGCQATATITISQPASALSATASQTDISCFEENQGQAQVTPTGGTVGSGYTYLWSNSAQTASVSGLSPQVYTVTVTDGNGCQASASVNISQYEPMTITMIFAPVSCFGSTDGELAVTAIEGGSESGIVTYSWSSNPGWNDDVISGLSGNQDYTVTVTDDQGCSATQTIFLEEPEAMVVQLNGLDALCFGTDDGSATVVSVLNATGAISYLWDPNAGSQITQTAIGLSAGIYSVEVTDLLGCKGAAVIEIDQPAPLQVDFAVSPNDCYGFQEGAVSVTPDGGIEPYQYNWSTGAGANAIDQLPAGLYYLTLTDANGCFREDSVEVSQPGPISPELAITDVSCFGDRDGRIQISTQGGTGPYLYSLNGIDYTGSSTLVGLFAGDYSLTIRDAKGCFWSQEVVVGQPPALEILIAQAPEITMNLGETVTLTSSTTNNQGPVLITWTAPYDGTLSCTECSETISSTQNTITYEVLAVDTIGCEASARVIVRVEKERIVLVPTAFSPNGDGENDLLLVHGQEGTIVTLFRVFDRWGELVYESSSFPTNDPSTGWDGSFKGKELNSAVFLWYVEVEYIDGLEQAFKGTTTLIR